MFLLLAGALFSGCGESREYSLVFDTRSQDTVEYHLEMSVRAVLPQTDTVDALHSSFQTSLIRTPLNRYDDSSTRYLMASQNLRYSSEQRSVEECRHIERYLSGQTMQYKMNAQGEILDMDSLPQLPELQSVGVNLRRIFLKIQPVLPGFAVNVGSRWERQHQLPAENGTSTYIYKSFEVVNIFRRNEQNMAMVRMNIKYRLTEEDNDSTDNRIRLESDEFILGTGQLVFNLDKGDLEQGEFEINGTLQADPHQGTELVQNGIQTEAVGSSEQIQATSHKLRVRQMIRIRRES